MAVSTARVRELIMSLEDTTAAPHVDREAFRALGNQFASLRSDGVLNVKLTLEDQALRCEADAAVFKPVDGGWGRMGYTTINLDTADELDVKSALLAAWSHSREKLVSKDPPKKPKPKPTGQVTKQPPHR
jgi:hypothetical protein